MADAEAAAVGGADRLELNRALDRDGLTPPIDLLVDVVEAVDLPTIAMVRPHDRGFVYRPAELDDMLDTAARFVSVGAAGIAIGPLTPKGSIDEDALVRLVASVVGAEVVFHRAFDVIQDQEGALETLVSAGVSRVLTSGGARTAPEGAAQIARLIRQARGRIEVLPGAGIGPGNASDLVRRTGCTQVHGTFRETGAALAGTSATVVAAVRRAAETAGAHVAPHDDE